jgi:hypothetical protein
MKVWFAVCALALASLIGGAGVAAACDGGQHPTSKKAIRPAGQTIPSNPTPTWTPETGTPYDM